MEPSFVPGCINILLGFEFVKLSSSGDANHDSSLPVPARQTGRSTLK